MTRGGTGEASIVWPKRSSVCVYDCFEITILTVRATRLAATMLTISLLASIALIAESGCTGPTRTSAPKIVVNLGATLEEVKQRSTMPVEKRNIWVGDVIVIERSRFVYDHPSLGFSLPDSRWVRLNPIDGVVTSAEVIPQTEYLNGEQAVAKREALVKLIDQAGWPRDRRFKSGEGIPYWKSSAEDEIYILLERTHEAGTPVANALGYTEDKYLIKVFFKNTRLDRELAAERIRKFRQRNGLD
ncbi:MAG: hypothetical protein DMD78_26755 [Candidatus Rokuibacteriota bacterium]|nr:MAG: hypothetical protein DMD78_26755 [Candidatus Rokubacteria bacterium]